MKRKFVKRIGLCMLMLMFLSAPMYVFADEPPCECGCGGAIQYIPFSIETGGTGATNLPQAQINLGIPQALELTSMQAVFDAIYPVGAIYMSVSNVDPGTLFPGTTWEAWGQGRVPVGMGSNGTTNYTTVDVTGGEETVTLVTANMPSHTHTQNSHRHNYGRPALFSDETSTDNIIYTPFKYKTSNLYYGEGSSKTRMENVAATNQNTGGNGAHNNMQPYVTCYMWKRVQNP